MNQIPVTSLFAKLLAEENIHVRVENTLSTAAFEPESRTLLLPNLSAFDTDAWLLFVAHEVGHAKYTPSDALSCAAYQDLVTTYGTTKTQIVVNIIEDIRIERRIRERYQGLAGVFAKGYRSLVGQSFFGKTDEELRSGWATTKLLDRLNLYAKIGGLLHLRLTQPDDVRWYNAAVNAASYEDVLAIAREILASQPAESQSSKPQQSEQGQQGQSSQALSSEQGQDQQQSSSEQGQPEQGEPGDQQEQSSQPEQGEPDQDAQTGAGSSNGAPASNPDDLTSDTYTAAQKHIAAARQTQEIGDTIMLPPTFAAQRENDYTVEDVLAGWSLTDAQQTGLVDVTRRARKQAAPVLSSMVNTFRMYQSAWQTRREETSRTGLLDMTKLSQHKLVDDVFLRRTDVPNAKNHGIVLFIDWSASMTRSIAHVLTQVLHLIWFAEQVQVPVEVYAFTDCANRKETLPEVPYDPSSAANTLARAHRHGTLVQYYRTDMSATDRLRAQAYLLTEAVTRGGVHYARNQWEYANRPSSVELRPEMPTALRDAAIQIVRDDLFFPDGGYAAHCALHTNPAVNRMGGTPLHQCMLSSTDVVRAFRSRHRVEQCVSVWLTDGADGGGVPKAYQPSDLVFDKHAHRWYVPYPTTHDDVVLADPTFGRTYRPRKNTSQFAQVLDAHRTRTGATVLVVDMTELPVYSYRRILSVADLNPFAESLQEPLSSFSNARQRNRRPLKGKTVRQTRRSVVLPTSAKSFKETGTFTIDRRDVESLPCDAMLVSHPSWWTASQQSTFDAKAARRVMDQDTLLGLDEEEIGASTISSYTVAERRTRVQTALTDAQRAVAMRKFADLIVPYIASGRDDATV